MPFAVELHFDDVSDRQVRTAWARLDAQGIRSLGSVPHSHYRPHVSMAVCDGLDAAKSSDALREAVGDVVGLVLPLASLGFFLTAESVAFLGVTPSNELLAAHRRIHAVVSKVASGLWPYYKPGAWMPHCTLATGVADRGAVALIVAAFELPIIASVDSVDLVEVPGGRVRARLG